jgi:lysophospholipase L1-like esterase
MHRNPSRTGQAIILISAMTIITVFGQGFFFNARAQSAGAIVGQLRAERAAKTLAIEDPAGAKPMDAFYASLARTALKQPGAITRVAHYGASIIEMDLISGPMRRLLQKKWGDSGHGFVHVSRPQPWYRPFDLVHKPSASWIAFALYEKGADRRFGYGGTVSQAFKPNAKSKIGTVKRGSLGTKASRFEILFPMEPAGGLLELKMDGKKLGAVNTASTAPEDAWTQIRVPDGRHLLELNAKTSNIRAYGVILERDEPGIVYDSLGVNGIGIAAYQNVDKNCWIGQLRHRNPNLVILGFGTNEARFNTDPVQFKQNMLGVISTVRRALPNASILLMGPVDTATKEGRKFVSQPLLPMIVAAQREAAAQAKVAYWCMFEAMGGPGTAAKWYAAKPRLTAGDLIHPKPKGGEVLAGLFYNALMQGFAEYLEENGLPKGPPPTGPADPLRKVEIL